MDTHRERKKGGRLGQSEARQELLKSKLEKEKTQDTVSKILMEHKLTNWRLEKFLRFTSPEKKKEGINQILLAFSLVII